MISPAFLFAMDSNQVFWDEQRRGTNFFNELETGQRFRDAKKIGVEVVRLVFSKWKADRPSFTPGDFLFGSLDKFTTIVEDDFDRLKSVLDDADRSGIKIVLSTLSLPGARWKQQNHDKLDLRLWKDKDFHQTAAKFWKELARRLRDHPTIVGYNLINEPYPEKAPPQFPDWYTGNYEKWYDEVRDSASDLNAFYEKTISAIREVDSSTPIVIDSGYYATPWAFKYLKAMDDKNVIYSFHMYEPYAFTNYENEGKYQYPGKSPIGESEQTTALHWNRKQLREFLSPVREFQKKRGIPSSRVFVGEFGSCRRNIGADKYLRDLISIFNEEGWHWAFYSFREDTWTGMDYELGSAPLPAEYWEALEQGKDIRQKFYKKNALFDAIKTGLGAPKNRELR